MDRRVQGSWPQWLHIESVDRVQPDGFRRWNCRSLDLCGDQTPFRGRAEDSYLRRFSSVGSWHHVAQPHIHAHLRPLPKSPHAADDTRGVIRDSSPSGGWGCNLQGTVSRFQRRAANDNVSHCAFETVTSLQDGCLSVAILKGRVADIKAATNFLTPCRTSREEDVSVFAPEARLLAVIRR